MEGELVVTLTGMDRSGAALAGAGPERLVVPGGIPGERVRVRRVRSLGRATLAEIVSLEEASPNRVTPRCRHAGRCGGCAWQHVAYPEQLRRKAASLDVLLRRAMGDRAPRVLPAIGLLPGPDGMPWGFRQKAAFVFGGSGAGLVMGHFARGTNDVVPVDECPVHAERANRVAFALRDALASAGVASAGPSIGSSTAASTGSSASAPTGASASAPASTGAAAGSSIRSSIGPSASAAAGGLVRHVVLRATHDGREVVAMLVATRDDPALREPLGALLAGASRPDGLVLNLHDRPGPYLVGRESKRVAGPGHVREEAIGPAFLVSPSSFFQTSVEAARTLVRLVVEAMPGERGLRVLDLYSGGGLFAVPLALRGHAVTAVEESRKGSRDAELNRRQNGVPEDRLKLVCARVEQALPRLADGAFDAVVLDPPREGCPPEVVRAVFERLRPSRGVLVSCNPEALARELLLAVSAGYRVLRVQPLDMFPHTPHVEAVAVLERGKGGPSPGSRRPTPPTPSSRSRTRGSRTGPARGRSRTP